MVPDQLPRDLCWEASGPLMTDLASMRLKSEWLGLSLSAIGLFCTDQSNLNPVYFSEFSVPPHRIGGSVCFQIVLASMERTESGRCPRVHQFSVCRPAGLGSCAMDFRRLTPPAGVVSPCGLDRAAGQSNRSVDVAGRRAGYKRLGKVARCAESSRLFPGRPNILQVLDVSRTHPEPLRCRWRAAFLVTCLADALPWSSYSNRGCGCCWF